MADPPPIAGHEGPGRLLVVFGGGALGVGILLALQMFVPLDLAGLMPLGQGSTVQTGHPERDIVVTLVATAILVVIVRRDLG